METNYKSLWSIILCAPELKGRMMFTVDALPMLCPLLLYPICPVGVSIYLSYLCTEQANRRRCGSLEGGEKSCFLPWPCSADCCGLCVVLSYPVK